MKKNQYGFAVVETILILVVIAIVAGTGWYVWHSTRQTNNSLSQAQNTSQNTPAPSKKTNTVKAANPATTQNSMTIAEWGISFSVPSSLSGLSYTANDEGISLVSPQLSATIAKCNGVADSGKNPFVYLSKYSGTYDSSGGTELSMIKQFNGFWVGASPAVEGVVCANQNDDKTLGDQYSAAMTALKDSFKTATQTP